jgi:hypothetical protein
MDLLPLDDPRWKELDHRNWQQGKRSDWAPDAPFVPDELAKLVENPADLRRFRRLWPWICSEGSIYPAAYAATPYFVAFAQRLPPEQRFEYLCVIGLVVTYSRPEHEESCEIKGHVADGYRRALREALPLTLEPLLAQHDVTQTRYLLAAVAALKGQRKLAEVLQDMDAISQRCPKCGELVFPEELQALTR